MKHEGFTVVKGKKEIKQQLYKKRKEHMEECYRQMYYEAQYYSEIPDLKKAAFCGVRYVTLHSIDTSTSHRDAFLFLMEIKDVTTLLETFTYRELIDIFPIRKDFDGWKYEAKDYWSTKEYLKDKDLDSVVGESIDEFLWTYYNSDIMNFGIKRTLIGDKLLKMEGKQGLLEGFLDVIDPKHNVHTYTINHEKGYIYDRETGKTSKLVKPKKKKPKYLNILEKAETEEI